MAFGITQGSEAALRSYIDNGHGYKVYRGSVLEFAPCPSLKGWLRVPSPDHRLNIFVNGVLSNSAFEFKQTSKMVEFTCKGEIAKFQQHFTIHLEITEP